MTTLPLPIRGVSGGVPPFISVKEKRELLSGEESGNESNGMMILTYIVEPPAKRFVPSKEHVPGVAYPKVSQVI